MRRHVVFLLAAVSAVSVPAAQETTRPIVVVNYRSATQGGQTGSVTLLNSGTYEILGSVDVGLNPHSPRFSPDGKLLYVLNGGKQAGGRGYITQSPGELTIIDPIKVTSLATIPLPYRPLAIVPAKDGSRLYVPTVGKANIPGGLTVLDSRTHEVLASIDTSARAA